MSFCWVVVVLEIAAEICLAVRACSFWSLLLKKKKKKCSSINKLMYGDAESRGAKEELVLD